MALSYEQFFGTGSQKLFTFEFDYLSRAHVKASVNGVEVPFNWVGTYSIELVTAALLNSVVEVRRTTPRVERLVRFTDGSTLVATDMNTSTLQAFFLAQEAFDQGAASLAVTEDGQYSAQTRRIANVGDPVNPQDVATKKWAETGLSSQLALATSEKTQAVTAKNQSEAARDASVAARNVSTDARDTANQHRIDAQAARDSASGHRLNAQNALNSTEAARDVTLTYRDEGRAARDLAVAARDVSITKRDEAQTFRNQAEAFALATDGASKMEKAQNLNDLQNKSTARTNLGLGSAATKNITISTGGPSGGADGDLWFQYN